MSENLDEDSGEDNIENLDPETGGDNSEVPGANVLKKTRHRREYEANDDEPDDNPRDLNLHWERITPSALSRRAYEDAIALDPNSGSRTTPRITSWILIITTQVFSYF